MAALEFRLSTSRLQAVKMPKHCAQKVMPADVPSPLTVPQPAPAPAAADPDPEPDVILPPPPQQAGPSEDTGGDT